MCVFCKIINNEIPAFKIYENEYVLAFLDINASTRGHTLVIPKEHSVNIFDLSEHSAQEILKATVIVSNLLKEKLQIESVNLINNSGELAGQTVMHFHLHILPRYTDDDIQIGPKKIESNLEKLRKLYQILIS